MELNLGVWLLNLTIPFTLASTVYELDVTK